MRLAIGRTQRCGQAERGTRSYKASLNLRFMSMLSGRALLGISPIAGPKRVTR